MKYYHLTGYKEFVDTDAMEKEAFSCVFSEPGDMLGSCFVSEHERSPFVAIVAEGCSYMLLQLKISLTICFLDHYHKDFTDNVFLNLFLQQ